MSSANRISEYDNNNSGIYYELSKLFNIKWKYCKVCTYFTKALNIM
jgi:hypothetical protein